MNIICLDCGLADPEAIWEYETLGTSEGPVWNEVARLILQHRTHRLIFLESGSNGKMREAQK